MASVGLSGRGREENDIPPDDSTGKRVIDLLAASAVAAALARAAGSWEVGMTAFAAMLHYLGSYWTRE
ncbi:MAG TPA: hypothetical protein VIW24_25985 [Aldersonia sp.]